MCDVAERLEKNRMGEGTNGRTNRRKNTGI